MTPPTINTADDALAYWREHVVTNPTFRPEVESSLTLFLDADRRVLSHCLESDGAPGWVFQNRRRILREALLSGAAGILSMHNHPDESPSPSKDDAVFTHHLAYLMGLLGLKFFDSIIVGLDGQVFSFAEQGVLEFREQTIAAKRDKTCAEALQTVLDWLGASDPTVLAFISESAIALGISMEQWLMGFISRALSEHFNPNPTEDRRLAFGAAVLDQGREVQFGLLDAARSSGRGITEFIWGEGKQLLAAKYGSKPEPKSQPVEVQPTDGWPDDQRT